MTFTIDIDERLRARLDEEAARRGVGAAEFARQLLEQGLAPGNGLPRADELQSLRQGLLRLAGTVKGTPSDLARNHDHYIHGGPRR